VAAALNIWQFIMSAVAYKCSSTFRRQRILKPIGDATPKFVVGPNLRPMGHDRRSTNDLWPASHNIGDKQISLCDVCNIQ